MRISRDRFIDQFAISIMVRSLRLWSRRSRAFPDHLPSSIYETLRVCMGVLPITAQEFHAIVEPPMLALHRSTEPGSRPDPKEVAGLVYDALDAAGIEVAIKPPVQSHGGGAKERRPTGDPW